MMLGMRTSKCFLFLILGLLIACSREQSASKKERYANTIYTYNLIFRFAEEMKHKHGMKLVGYVSRRNFLVSVEQNGADRYHESARPATKGLNINHHVERRRLFAHGRSLPDEPVA